MKELKKIIYAMLLSVAFIAFTVGLHIGFALLTGYTLTFGGITFSLVFSVILLLCYGIVEAYTED